MSSGGGPQPTPQQLFSRLSRELAHVPDAGPPGCRGFGWGGGVWRRRGGLGRGRGVTPPSPQAPGSRGSGREEQGACIGRRKAAQLRPFTGEDTRPLRPGARPTSPPTPRAAGAKAWLRAPPGGSAWRAQSGAESAAPSRPERGPGHRVQDLGGGGEGRGCPGRGSRTEGVRSRVVTAPAPGLGVPVLVVTALAPYLAPPLTWGF